MFEFAVKLIKVPNLGNLTGVQVFELMVNATHVAGNYWIFEGDLIGFNSFNDPEKEIKVVADGVTEGIGEMDSNELVQHCMDIFGVDLSGEEPGWKMMKKFR